MVHITLPLILFLFPLAFSPGPGNMFFAANGARFGFRATLPANAGYHMATWVVTAAIGFGLMSIMGAIPQVFVALKFAGALYVLLLAWKMFRAGLLQGDQTARPARFGDGVVLLILNPKAYVIIALMFTQFLGGTDGGLVKILFMTSVFTLNNLVAFSIWALIGDRIAAYFRTPRSAQRLNTLFAVTLAGVAVWMVMS